MHRRYSDYVYQSLSASGLVVLDPRQAFVSRRDLWASMQSAAQDFNLAEIEGELKSRGAVIFALADGVPVATRSTDNLAKRLEWQTGRPVTTVEVVSGFAKPRQVPEMPTTRQREKADDQAQLRKLAAQEPPSHDCPLRFQILDAREKLGAAA